MDSKEIVVTLVRGKKGYKRKKKKYKRKGYKRKKEIARAQRIFRAMKLFYNATTVDTFHMCPNPFSA